MHTAKLGDRVRVQYSRIDKLNRARLLSPQVLEFTAGSRDVMPGLSSGVIGMVLGEHKRLTLQPAEAYGDFQPELVTEIPRAKIPKRIKLRVGKRLSALSTWTGRQRRVRVVEISPQTVKVDGNHALAGQVIELEVSLISVDSSADANRTKPQFDLGGES